MHMKFEIEIPKQELHSRNHVTQSRTQKVQYVCQVVILKVTSLEFTSFYQYTQVMCYCILDLIFNNSDHQKSGV